MVNIYWKVHHSSCSEIWPMHESTTGCFSDFDFTEIPCTLFMAKSLQPTITSKRTQGLPECIHYFPKGWKTISSSYLECTYLHLQGGTRRRRIILTTIHKQTSTVNIFFSWNCATKPFCCLVYNRCIDLCCLLRFFYLYNGNLKKYTWEEIQTYGDGNPGNKILI